ncbi:hypothetical protein Aperf_G00000125462 [Anoplocephala perfoliata]
MIGCNMISGAKAFLLFDGLPGAGKTYIADKLVKDSKNFKFISIHFDDNISFKCSDDFSWKNERSDLCSCIETLVSECGHGNLSCRSELLKINAGDHVNKNLPVIFILDDNFFYRSMRKLYYRLSKTLRVAYMTVSFRTPLEICLKRNSERKDSVPDHVITRMNARFEWPDAPWERYNLDLGVLDSDAIVEIVEEFTRSVLKQPLVFIDWEELKAEKARSREINKSNPVHALDGVLRSLVKACISSLDPELKQKHGKEFSKVKAKTLTQLKPSACEKFSLPSGDFEAWIHMAFAENVLKDIPLNIDIFE